MFDIYSPLYAIEHAVYYMRDHGKFRVPDDSEALLWLVSEIGELSEAVVTHAITNWHRNNVEKNEREVSEDEIVAEAADVIIMATLFILAMERDPTVVVREKIKAMLEKRGLA